MFRVNNNVTKTEAYLGLFQTSMMEIFIKIVNSLAIIRLAIFATSSIIDQLNYAKRNCSKLTMLILKRPHWCNYELP